MECERLKALMLNASLVVMALRASNRKWKGMDGPRVTKSHQVISELGQLHGFARTHSAMTAASTASQLV